MIRVKDIEKSLKFYQEVLGMSLFRTVEQAAAGFNLYFLGYPGAQGAPTETDGPPAHREGLLELTWNYGTEKDESFRYHNGNDEPQGFGHICMCPGVIYLFKFFFLKTLPLLLLPPLLSLAWNRSGTLVRGSSQGTTIFLTRGEPQKFAGISVDNIDAACQRFEDLNANWKKRLTDGRMKNVAFLLDPDGYWVEIVQNERFVGKENAFAGSTG